MAFNYFVILNKPLLSNIACYFTICTSAKVIMWLNRLSIFKICESL